MVIAQGKIWEKSFDWAYGCASGPEVEVFTHIKWVSFGLLDSDLQELKVVSVVYGIIIDRQVAVLVILGI